MPKLTRNKAITLRMTQDEFENFKTKMEKAKQKTQTDFILALLHKKIPKSIVEL